MPQALSHMLMRKALSQAKAAMQRGEVPVGALLAKPDGTVITLSGNRVEEKHDATRHAELEVIQAACKILGAKVLTGYDLYVTLEPCPLCASAIAASRISRVYYGAYDPKSGGTDHGPRIFDHTHHKPEIYGGILEGECSALLKAFFEGKR